MYHNPAYIITYMSAHDLIIVRCRSYLSMMPLGLVGSDQVTSTMVGLSDTTNGGTKPWGTVSAVVTNTASLAVQSKMVHTSTCNHEIKVKFIQLCASCKGTHLCLHILKCPCLEYCKHGNFRVGVIFVVFCDCTLIMKISPCTKNYIPLTNMGTIVKIIPTWIV